MRFKYQVIFWHQKKCQGQPEKINYGDPVRAEQLDAFLTDVIKRRALNLDEIEIKVLEVIRE